MFSDENAIYKRLVEKGVDGETWALFSALYNLQRMHPDIMAASARREKDAERKRASRMSADSADAPIYIDNNINNKKNIYQEGGVGETNSETSADAEEPLRRRRKSLPPEDWKPRPRTLESLKAKGESEFEISKEIQRFIWYCHANHKLYSHFDMAFLKWMDSDLRKKEGYGGNGHASRGVGQTPKTFRELKAESER